MSGGVGLKGAEITPHPQSQAESRIYGHTFGGRKV